MVHATTTNHKPQTTNHKPQTTTTSTQSYRERCKASGALLVGVLLASIWSAYLYLPPHPSNMWSAAGKPVSFAAPHVLQVTMGRMRGDSGEIRNMHTDQWNGVSLLS